MRARLRLKAMSLERPAVHLIVRVPIDTLSLECPFALLFVELPILQPCQPAGDRIGKISPDDLGDIVKVDEKRAFDLASDHEGGLVGVSCMAKSNPERLSACQRFIVASSGRARALHRRSRLSTREE